MTSGRATEGYLTTWDESAAPPTGRRHRKRRIWLRVLIALLLTLVVLLVLADRLGVVYAEHRIAQATQTKLTAENIQTTGTPSVSISGFPFLTQVLSGHYGQIDINVPQPESLGVRLDSVHVTASNVDAPLGSVMNGGSIVAQHLKGTAHIDWTNLQTLVDMTALTRLGVDTSALQITSTGKDKIKVAAPMTMASLHYTLTASGTVSVRNGVLHVSLDGITTGVPMPSIIADRLPSTLSFDAKIPPLPYGLKINTVTADARGMTLSASATNVTIG